MSLYLTGRELALIAVIVAEQGNEPTQKECIRFAREQAGKGIRAAIKGRLDVEIEKEGS